MEINYRSAVNLKTLITYYDLLLDGKTEWAEHVMNSAGPAKRRVLTMLEAEQRRCSVRLLNPYQICIELSRVDEHLRGIAKKALEGTVVDVDAFAQSFPSAYRGIPESTKFKVVFHRGSWWLIEVYRSPVRCRGSAHRCRLSESAAAALIASRTEW